MSEAKALLASLEALTEEQIAALPPDRLKELIETLETAKGHAMAAITRRLDGPYQDELFERVVQLILTDLPEALGIYVGRVAAQVVEYGDSCQWGTMDEDAEKFKEAMLEGFHLGLADATVVPQTWPEREQVIEAFATVTKLAGSLPLAHHIDCFEREKHFTPEQLA